MVKRRKTHAKNQFIFTQKNKGSIAFLSGAVNNGFNSGKLIRERKIVSGCLRSVKGSKVERRWKKLIAKIIANVGSENVIGK